MKRTYNDKISLKANESLARRAQKVQMEKRLIVVIGIIVISLGILLGSSISVLPALVKRHGFINIIRVFS